MLTRRGLLGRLLGAAAAVGLAPVAQRVAEAAPAADDGWVSIDSEEGQRLLREDAARPVPAWARDLCNNTYSY